MKKQRGQVIIEFALILPLFLLMIFGLIYSGMLFYDYSTLSNVARSAARETAIASADNNGNIDTGKIIQHYYDKDEHKFHGGLITSLYIPKVDAINPHDADSSDGAFVINIEDKTDEPDDIIVTIVMHLNTSLPWVDIVLPEDFTIRYHMRRDTTS